MNALTQLRQLSTIVADTGKLEDIQRYQPTDATTNPSLILAATDSEQARSWGRECLQSAGGNVARARERLTVRFGAAILEHVQRWVSTELDPRLSFDTEGSIRAAEGLIEEYARIGVGPERVLVKLASTWEGISAARVLEARGIRCNMTLLFSFAQARLCADSGVTLVSPFVGRILDWHKAQGLQVDSAEDDPGVQSVRRIYRWIKARGYSTLVMGASFRNTGEILGLAGCDLLTIAPKLLAELEADDTSQVTAVLAPGQAAEDIGVPGENAFRWAMNEDAMATEKLAEGIRRFAADQAQLDAWLSTL